MKNIYLSIIIPAYNEEKRISKTLLEIDKYLDRQDYQYEILVVSDGSKDKTAAIVKKFANLINGLKLIDNQQNHGKGWVVRQGMLEAEGDYRIFMDADNSTTVDHFEKMIPLIKEGKEVVIGSRDHKDAAGAKQAVPQSFIKRQFGNLGNLLIQLLAVRGIWDTQCGFKLFSRKAAEDIFSRAKIDGFGFDIECLALARKLGYPIGIIPVYWINSADSKVSWKSYLKVFKDLFTIKLNLIKNRYEIEKDEK